MKIRPHAGELTDILEVFTGLEPDCAAGRDTHFLARPRVAADAPLAGFYLKNAKSSQLNAITALHGESHGVKNSIARHLSLDFGDVGDIRNLIDDVDLDHGVECSKANSVTTIKIIT